MHGNARLPQLAFPSHHPARAPAQIEPTARHPKFNLQRPHSPHIPPQNAPEHPISENIAARSAPAQNKATFRHLFLAPWLHGSLAFTPTPIPSHGKISRTTAPAFFPSISG
jgi:hypothetical protein